MKQRILYFDCFAGISGDMTVAALIDLGVDFEKLKSKLNELRINGYNLDLRKVKKNSISALKFDVNLEQHEHIHRNLQDIEKIITNSNFNENVKDMALKMFSNIARAEAKIHDTSINKIHFHEVGAIDSIIDILSVAFCIDELKVDKIYSSPASCGKGFVKCAHGKIPVPSPATLEILKNIPINFTEIPNELTTPTGATILKTLVTEFKKMPGLKILKTGYGAGSRNLEIPAVLRVLLAEIDESKDQFIELVTNIDDMNPEIYSYLFEKLFENDALDIWFDNIIMKKNRPGIKLSIICKADHQQKLKNIIFRETTTFGIREYPFSRTELNRKIFTVETEYGEINIKVGYLNGKMIKYSPEFEDCKKCAKENNVSLKIIYDSATLSFLQNANKYC